MNITFYGAAQTVTGSCYVLRTAHTNVLIDCGMFQGGSHLEELNQLKPQFDPSTIDFMLLTHAHVDHSGMIPKLNRYGFKAPIITTSATIDLCNIILPDCAHIQKEEVDWHNRKRERAGQLPLEVLYDQDDVLDVLSRFQAVSYGEVRKLNDEIEVRFNDAGHILGSASIEVWVTEGEKKRKIVFSGDVGNFNQVLVRNPDPIESADYLLIETTYGNRCHKSREATRLEFRQIIHDAIGSNSNIIIPAFAVERTQELIYELGVMQREGQLGNIPVYVDSPMAVSATEVFQKHSECYNEATWNIIRSSNNPLELPNLIFSRTADESRAINNVHGAIIISASGMAHAGRILHHLKHNLWQPQNHVLFVGFQVKGTLGRQILDGAKTVKIMGEEIAVKAQIHTLGGFSAHADQDGLMRYINQFQSKPKHILLDHGEPEVMQVFQDAIKQTIGIPTTIPTWLESVELE